MVRTKGGLTDKGRPHYKYTVYTAFIKVSYDIGNEMVTQSDPVSEGRTKTVVSADGWTQKPRENRQSLTVQRQRNGCHS